MCAVKQTKQLNLLKKELTMAVAKAKRGRPRRSTSTTDLAKTKSTDLSQPSTQGNDGVPSKSELIRKYAVTYPDFKPKDIANATGFAYKYVNQVLWHWRNKQKNVKVVKYLSEVLEGEKEFGNSNVDLVNQPPHYTQGGIETIDFIEAKQLNYNLGNVVKYITRADHKGNRLEDLKKARWYLDREITASS